MSHNKVPIHKFHKFFLILKLFSVFMKKLKLAICCRIVRINLEGIEDKNL